MRVEIAWEEKFKELLNFVKERMPNIDLREGTAYYDFLKAISLTYIPLMSQIEELKSSLDITNTQMADDLYTILMRNLFINRISGIRAVGVVRMYFLEPFDFEIDTDVAFVSQEGLKFHPVEAMRVSKESMEYNFENNYYYVDVPVIAENAGVEYNIPPNSIVDVENYLDDRLVRVTNLSAFEGGVNYETNEQLYARARDSISERSLVTPRGHHAVLFDKIPTLDRVQVIGYMDPEMERDIIDVPGIGATHVGGKIDVYLKPKQVGFVETIIDNIPEELTISPDTPHGFRIPVVFLKRVVRVDPISHEELNYELAEGSDYVVEVLDPVLNYSTKQKFKISIINSDLVGSSIKFVYYSPEELQIAQEILLQDEVRVVNADPLVYSFVPALTIVNLQLRAKPEWNEDTTESLRSEVKQFIESIPTNYKRTSLFPEEAEKYNILQVSDLINIAYRYPIDAVTYLQVYVIRYNRDGTKVTYSLNLSASNPFIALPRCWQFFVKDIAISLT